MTIIEIFQKKKEEWISAFILFGVSVAVFGLQILWLGYTVDDWIILYSYYSKDLFGLMEYSYMGSRPLVFWAWYLGFKILGTSPLNWQIWTLLWRYLTVLIFWIILKRVWPRNLRRNLIIALFFLIYPVFFQQPSALTFSFHWICFALFMISILFMIMAISNEKKFLFFSSVSILSAAVGLFSQEFFVGLELLRVLIIWKVLEKNAYSNKQRFKKTLINWFPYLFLFIGYLIWRFNFMPVPGVDRNSLKLVNHLLESPINTVIQTLVTIFRDFINIVFGVWYHSYKPEVVSIQPVYLLVSWVLVGIIFLGLLLLLFKIKLFTNDLENSPTFEISAIVFGTISTLLGMLPGWLIERSVTDPSGLYNDRFGLAAMPGVSILLVGIVLAVIKSKRNQIFILCLLIALASGQHFREISEYRWSWEKQLRLYWQLKWRMPNIESPLAIYGDGALVKFIGSWATVSALNIMYPSDYETYLEPLWYFDLTKRDVIHSVENGAPVKDIKNNLKFFAKARDSIIIQTESFPTQCVWIVDSNDVNNPFLTPEVRYALPLSNFEKISSFDESTLDSSIFGSELSHDWCYYYQKADLAYQNENWINVLELWNEAELKGFSPYNGPELIHFIQAAAFLEEFDLSLKLSRQATYLTENMNDYLCLTWENIYQESNDKQRLRETILEVNDLYYCRINLQ